jgi:hypothetical protein
MAFDDNFFSALTNKGKREACHGHLGAGFLRHRWRLVNGRELYDMSLDPGQKTDVAVAHAGVVRELQEAYDRWWDDISSRFDEFTHIIVGSDKRRFLCLYQTAVMSGKDVPRPSRARA